MSVDTGNDLDFSLHSNLDFAGHVFVVYEEGRLGIFPWLLLPSCSYVGNFQAFTVCAWQFTLMLLQIQQIHSCLQGCMQVTCAKK